ncbi:MAG: SDR family oxidoreductase [Planctomycetota bacterium]|nr:SDR family oxidoreductase [Planctomycetota bacterium]
MARYLVTGAGGFIGSHILQRLLEMGESAMGLDNFSTGFRRNADATSGTVVDGDINDADLLGRLLRGVEVVFHEAAVPSVPRSISDPLGTHRANVQGTLSLLVACTEAGVRRIVYASSSSIYGDQPTPRKQESQAPDPLSPYAAQKWTGEVYCRVLGKLKGLETVALRYFNVFGPRQDPNSPYSAVIPIFIRSLLAGERPTIYGDGEQTRDFTYVGDVVEANLKASNATGVSGEVINVAAGEKTTVNELFRIIRSKIGSELEPIFEASRPGDVRHSQADNSKLKRLLEFEPSHSLEDGLDRTVAWYRDSR